MVSTPVSPRLDLSGVTLCAAATVNVVATLTALRRCVASARFSRCILFTDDPVATDHPEIEVVSIDRLGSAADYSRFVLRELVDHISTPHCMIAQWDGFIVNPRGWDPAFLDYDYIGARWPQFADGHDVGNGGFSLRSRRLMLACRQPGFVADGAEDVAIGRTGRPWLEAQGIRFAPAALADHFSAERAGSVDDAFGMHGVFNLPAAVGPDAFWQIYRSLDARRSVWVDGNTVARAVATGQQPWRRLARLALDRLSDATPRLAKPIARRQRGAEEQGVRDA